MLYPGSRFPMAAELLESYIRQVIAAHSASPVVEIAWQGRADADGARLLPPLGRACRSPPATGAAVPSTPSRRTGRSSIRAGPRSSRTTASWSGSLSTGHARSTTPPGLLAAAAAASISSMRGLDHLHAGGVDFNVLTTVHGANEHAASRSTSSCATIAGPALCSSSRSSEASRSPTAAAACHGRPDATGPSTHRTAPASAPARSRRMATTVS